jgi:hypothetical protein
MGSNEEGGDGEEVVCKVVFVAGAFIFTVNHEPSANFREDELQEVLSKSRKPVSVQDHNL